MKETFNHKATSSFYLWFDNYLLDKGEAFINETGIFYPTVDEQIPGFNVLSSSYKQFVWDDSVSGSTVISGVYPSGNQTLIQRGQDGLKVDYQNGRILSTGNLSSPLYSGVFSRKEFNTYLTNERDLPLVFEKVMGNNPNLDAPATGIEPNTYAAPCCIISMSSSQNAPFAFGGMDQTDVTARVLIVSKDMWQMDGILSIFRDSNNLKIPLIPASGLPLDFYGDLKFNYNYRELFNQFCGNGFYVDKVIASKVSERTNKNSTYFVSSLEFQLASFRYPRSDL